MRTTPHELIKSWSPHVLLLAMVGGCLWLLVTVMEPLRDPLLLAISLAALTYPVLFEPIHRATIRLLPNLDDLFRRQTAGILSTLVLVAIVASPILLVLLATVGSVGEIWDLVLAVALDDQEKLQHMVERIQGQINITLARYPELQKAINTDLLEQWLFDMIGEVRNFGPSFVSFLFAGTGSLLATLVLAMLILSTCFSQGGRLIGYFLHFTPLDETEIETLGRRHRQVVLRMLNDSVATALVRGGGMGVVIWLFTGINGILIALVAAFVSLVPVVGAGMVWIPLVVWEWSHGRPVAAVLLALCCLAVNWAVSWGRAHLGRRIDQDADWTGFWLFLGLVGGLLSYGIMGFVVGPMVVVLSILIIRHCLPIYLDHESMTKRIQDGPGDDD